MTLVLLSYKSSRGEHDLEGQIKHPDTPPIKTVQQSTKYAFHCSPCPHLRRPGCRRSSELVENLLFDNADGFSRLRTRNLILPLNWSRILPRFRLPPPSSRRVVHSPPRLPQPATHRTAASPHLHHRLPPALHRCLRLRHLKTKALVRRAVLIVLHLQYLVLPSLIKGAQARLLFLPRPAPSRPRHPLPAPSRPRRPRPLLRGLTMWAQAKHPVLILART